MREGVPAPWLTRQVASVDVPPVLPARTWLKQGPRPPGRWSSYVQPRPWPPHVSKYRRYFDTF